MSGQGDRAFEGRRVIVAGGTAGLGGRIAEHFGREGAALSVCGRRPSTAHHFQERLRAEGVAVDAAPVDVTDQTALAAWLASATDALGGVDIFVANAGSSPPDETWTATLGATLLYVVEACQRLAEPLTATQGNVVMLGSVAALTTDTGPKNAAYGAGKAALAHYVTTLAQQWGPTGVRVNMVVPGPVLAPGGRWEDESIRGTPLARALKQRAALRRFVTATEVAEAVAFLAGPSASGITGTTLRVDGGFLHTAGW